MTPQLQQAIKLLQLNRLELAETIMEELLENPVLEEGLEESEEEEKEAAKEASKEEKKEEAQKEKTAEVDPQKGEGTTTSTGKTTSTASSTSRAPGAASRTSTRIFRPTNRRSRGRRPWPNTSVGRFTSRVSRKPRKGSPTGSSATSMTTGISRPPSRTSLRRKNASRRRWWRSWRGSRPSIRSAWPRET